MEVDLSQEQRTRQGLQWRITNITIIIGIEFIITMMFLVFSITITNNILSIVLGVFGIIIGVSYIRSVEYSNKLMKDLNELNKGKY